MTAQPADLACPDCGCPVEEVASGSAWCTGCGDVLCTTCLRRMIVEEDGLRHADDLVAPRCAAYRHELALARRAAFLVVDGDA